MFENWKEFYKYQKDTLKILPTVYEDSLSYYELISKLFKFIEDFSDNIDSIRDVVELFIQEYDTKNSEKLKEFLDKLLETGQLQNMLDDLQNSSILELQGKSEDISKALDTGLENLDLFGKELKVVTSQLAHIAISVEDFREDGKSDADVIQDTFNHVESLIEASGWGLRTQIYFGNGITYRIDKPLHFRRHKFSTLFGYGSTIIVDSVEVLPYMIDLSSEGDTYYTGYLRLKGLTFNANNNASKIIEGINTNSQSKYGLYYSYIDDCQFVGLMANSYAIHGLSWACFLKNNVFLGYGENSSALKQWRGTALHLAEASNGVYVTDCNFSRLDRVATGSSVKVTFKNNIIDSLKKSAFLMDGTGLTIKDNYFEAVGGEIETVELYSQPSQQIDASIILRGSPMAWNFPVATIDISNNTVTNQRSNDFVALANATNVKVKHNHFSLMQKKENLVRLFGDGMGRTSYAVDGLEIANNMLYSANSESRESLFDSVLNFELVELISGHGLENIVVKDMVQEKKRRLPINLYKNDFSEYASASDWTVSEVVLQDEKVFKLEKISNTYTNTISLKQYLNKLKGQYVRVSFRQQNTQEGASLRFTIDDGVKSELYIAGNSTTRLRGYEFLYKIDEDATDFYIAFNTFARAGQSIYIADFSLTPAWYDLEIFE